MIFGDFFTFLYYLLKKILKIILLQKIKEYGKFQ